MNKGRSRLFSERMKGVFKSRSRVVNSKIPDNRNSGTDSSIPEIKYNSKDGSIQPFTVASSSCYGLMNAKSANEKVEVIEDKSYKSINDYPSGSRNEGRCALSARNELHIKPNVIGESCQSCLPNVDINQNSSHLMNSRLNVSQKNVNEGTFNNNNNTNNNNNYYSSLRVPKSYRCGVGICHYCLKQICVCENGNGISNNNIVHSLDGSFRFSQVLQNAFGEEKNNRNEFIILALGIQHYIQEVFNALDYSNNGYVYYEDLQILCKLLGKDLKYESNSDVSFSSCEDNNDNQICGNNSCKTHLHFGKFSEIICNKFSKLSETSCLEKRKNSQLVNAVVNVSRRSESLSILSKQLEELERDYLDFKNKNKYFTLPNINNSVNNCKSCTKYQLMEGNNANNNHLESMKLQKIILLQQQELQCLREVIEDLRISLQCSDAENLSLRVREVKSHRNINSLSDDQISKAFTLSTDDDKDSIDRIIQNFPSNEDLNMSSNESLLTIRSLQSRSPSRSLSQIKNNQIDIDSRSNLLSQKILERMGDDDLGLNKEIQLVYRELSDTRSELEDTRTDLESTVTEIQTKNDQINRLMRNLNEMKSNFDKSVEENSNLKEKIILLKNIEKNKDTQIDILEQQVFELKSELSATDGQIKILSNDLQNLQLKRKKDMQQMTRARNLIAKSLAFVNKDNSETSKSIETLQKFPAKSDAILKKDDRIINREINNYSNCDNNNNNNKNVNNNYKRTVTFNKDINDCNKIGHNNNGINDNSVNSFGTNSTIKNSENLKKLSSNYQPIFDNKFQTKEQARLNLSTCNSRRSEFNVDHIPIVKEENKAETILCNGPRSSSPPRVHPKDKPRSLDNSSVPEDKPILEVKPNLIRPIGIMKPILKNPPPIPTSRSSSLEDLKPYSKLESEFQDKYSSLKLDRKTESGKLSSLSKIGRSPEVLDCKTQVKSSTQILEGLEAEVEYMLSLF